MPRLSFVPVYQAEALTAFQERCAMPKIHFNYIMKYTASQTKRSAPVLRRHSDPGAATLGIKNVRVSPPDAELFILLSLPG